MDKPNVNASFVKRSDVDSHASSLDELAYTFMLNGNIEGTDGEGLNMRQNEPSNLLCVRFEGYHVLHHLVDISRDRTFFFLTNPTTGCSQLVYVPNQTLISSTEDVEKVCNCNISQTLATPLEDQVQTPICTATTILQDCGCENGATLGERCLNWNIDFPISAYLKDEKCGAVIYFVDGNNFDRRVEVDNLDQYYTTDEVPCGDDTTPACIDCEKLKISRDYSVPCLNFQGLSNGGSLKHGAYVFYLAYCDDNGNEVTRYMSITGEIMVKDPNKAIYQQPELDAVTNYSINLDIENIDTRYRYYKIAVIQKTSVDGTLSPFVVGTYPTNKTKISYSTERDKERITLEELTVEYPYYLNSKTVSSANKMLFRNDLQAMPEVNLQPVVNLIGEFALWQTEIMEEEAYSDPTLIESHRGYMRDEVEPFSIRFFTNTGYVTSLFPLISRLATDEDIYFGDNHDEELPEDFVDSVTSSTELAGYQRDVYSVLKNTSCNSSERKERWQFYNTATNEGLLNCVDLAEETDQIETQKTCEVNTESVENGGIIGNIVLDGFEEGETYEGFIQYLLDHQDDGTLDAYPWLVLENYNLDPSNPDYQQTADGCCPPDNLFRGNCGAPGVPVTTHRFRPLYGGEPEVDIIYSPVPSTEDDVDDADYYRINSAPAYCQVYQPSQEYNYEPDCDFIEELVDLAFCARLGGTWINTPGDCPGDADTDPDARARRVVRERLPSVYGSPTCTTASELPFNFDQLTPTHLDSYYSDGTSPTLYTGQTYKQDGVNTPLVTTGLDGAVVTNDIEGSLSKNAVWFKLTVPRNGLPQDNLIPRKLAFNLSEASECSAKDKLVYRKELRVTFFEDCTRNLLKSGATPVLEGYSYDSGGGLNAGTSTVPSVMIGDYAQGAILVIDLSYYIDNEEDIDNIYVAVDQPWSTGLRDHHRICRPIPGKRYLPGTCNCFSLNVYSANIDQVSVTIPDPLPLLKECTYTALCNVVSLETIKCDPFPWENGRFAFWQSTDIYPDNAELYNSQTLTIKPGDIPTTVFLNTSGTTMRDHFESVFTSGVDGQGNYILNPETDFRCKFIRWFKFPDNEVSPISDGAEYNLAPFSTNKLFPIGLKLNNELINAMLDVAVTNGLMTQEFRDTISGYEVFRGDVRLNKSIIGKGLLYDMYRYIEGGKYAWFSNFPYNNLGNNRLIYTDQGRDEYLGHPFESLRNIRFTFHSPDFHYERPIIPFELKKEAYFTGNSRGRFAPVENHPYMVILGRSAYRWARALAVFESLLVAGTSITEFIIQSSQNYWFEAGLGGVGGNPIGAGISAGAVLAYSFLVGAQEALTHNQKYYEWLKIFDENGTPYNFASYYSSEGFYNTMSTGDLSDGNKLRGIYNSEYLNPGSYTLAEGNQSVRVNHTQRESAIYLSLGRDENDDPNRPPIDLILGQQYTWESTYLALEHPATLRSTDDSRFKLSDKVSNCSVLSSEEEYDSVSEELTADLYAPYVSLKNYLPGQYGTVDSVDWISTNYCSDLNETDPCYEKTIFGGDTFITRFALKRKFPFFVNTMITPTGALGDFTPFDYTAQRNVGYPRFYVNYKTDMSNNFGRFEMPTIRSYYNLDCASNPKMYVKAPSKFYLYYYGIPSFLVESRINNHFRHGENTRERNFYPNTRDYVAWTQEQNVSIRDDNYFFYNPIYSTENDIYGYRTLPFNYDSEEWACRFDHWDRTIYSEPDNNEQDLIDNWSTFRANNYYDFGNEYGRFIGLKPLASQRVLGLFENGAVVFNAFNTIPGTVEDFQVGTGGVFATRPTEFYRSDLGFGGTQHRAFVSSEFGHFWVDAKRGRVFQINPNGEGLQAISRNRWENWFRDNLPFKIKKAFPEISDEALDNPEKDIGITMGWDDRYSRLFITKKDYEYNGKGNCNIVWDQELGFTENGESIDITKHECFTECSWTVAYSPKYQDWIGWYSFKPNFYVSHNNYFQTGYNTGNANVWSHLLTNRSYQVFQGELYPWIIEVPTKNEFTNKYMESIAYWLDVRRYHGEHDFAENRNQNFDYMVVYNHDENTGRLNLVRQQANNKYQRMQYPKYNTDSWDVLAVQEHRQWSVNVLYDIVKDKYNNVPIWLHDCADVEKELNPKALDYRPTRKNKLRGDWFFTRFYQTSDSQHKYIFKTLIAQNKMYRR